MNSYSESSRDRCDTGYHVPRDRRAIGSGVKLWVAFPFKNQDTLTDGLQHRTPYDGTIGTTYLKPDDFLDGRQRRRHAADRHAAHIAHVLRRIVGIEVRGIRSHRGAVCNDNVSLHPVLQKSTAAPGSHCVARMRKAAPVDADVLRSGADHDSIADVCRWLL